MANKTYSQYISNTGISSNPDTSLSNFISNFHDYFSMRTSQNESIMIIGDYENGNYNNATVYTYNGNNRTITSNNYDVVTVTAPQTYYTRGNITGIPSVPNYTNEYNLGVLFALFIGLSAIVVKFTVKTFWSIVRRASNV